MDEEEQVPQAPEEQAPQPQEDPPNPEGEGEGGEAEPAQDINDMSSEEVLAQISGALKEAISILSKDNDKSTKFATTPGRIDPTDTIDMTTKSGVALYSKACERLSEHRLFHGKPDDIVWFIEALLARARDFSWDNDDQGVIYFLDDAENIVNLLKSYGKISLEKIREQMIKCTGTGTHSQSRMAQNNKQMFECLSSSITSTLAARLNIFKAQYTHEAINHEGETETYYLAPCYFKKMMDIANHDCRASEMRIREDLDNLSHFMAQFKSDIPKFNTHVNNLLKRLEALGVEYEGGMYKLFQAYQTCADREFRRYITKKLDDWNDGINGASEWTVESLMSFALNKYNMIYLSGKWKTSSAAEKQIMALSAEVNNVRGELRLAGQAAQNDQESYVPPFRRGATSKGKARKPSTDKSRQKKDEQWKKTAPAAGEPKVKNVNGSTWKWCDHHMSWANHSTSDCRMGKQRVQAQQRDRRMVNSATAASINYMAAMAAASRD